VDVFFLIIILHGNKDFVFEKEVPRKMGTTSKIFGFIYLFTYICHIK